MVIHILPCRGCHTYLVPNILQNMYYHVDLDMPLFTDLRFTPSSIPTDTYLCIMCLMRSNIHCVRHLFMCVFFFSFHCTSFFSFLQRFKKNAKLQGYVKQLRFEIVAFCIAAFTFIARKNGSELFSSSHLSPWKWIPRLMSIRWRTSIVLALCLIFQSILELNDNLNQFALATFCVQHGDLINLLRESSESHPGAFGMDDLVWTNYMTNGYGIPKTSMLVVILWDRIEDFIKGEQ